MRAEDVPTAARYQIAREDGPKLTRDATVAVQVSVDVDGDALFHVLPGAGRPVLFADWDGVLEAFADSRDMRELDTFVARWGEPMRRWSLTPDGWEEC